jgi:glycosyltransferase involved in cell wall biosynthesis
MTQPGEDITPKCSFSGRRILMIAPQPFYTDRGTPMNTLLMCGVLTEAGFRVDLATFPTGRDICIPNLHIYRPPRIPGLTQIPIGASWTKLIYDGVLFFYALILVMTRRYNVLHGIEEGVVIAAILGWITQTPIICDMDSNLPEQFAETHSIGNNWMQKLVKLLYNHAVSRSSLIIAVCKSLALLANRIAPNVAVFQIEDIPLSEHRICVMKKPEIVSSEAIRLRFCLDERRIVLYTGNLQRYQGIDLLLKSWQWLEQHLPDNDAILVMVGGAQNEIKAFIEQCRRMGIEQSVRWIGQRPVAEMDAWMDLSDILVSPRSLGDNTPLKIFSYMASGKAVIATRRPTHTQVVDESEAFLAEPAPDDFGNALLTALSDELEAQRRGRKAQKKIRRCYTYETFRRKLLDAYCSILNPNWPS